jgi:hypothetical protein
MISAPASDTNRAVLRAVLEAAAQFSAVTAALARIYETTHPTEFQRAIAQWRENVTDASNDHELRLASLEEIYRPRIRLSQIAQTFAAWLARTSIKGLTDPIAFESVRTSFPDFSKQDAEDAISELKYYGLAEVGGALGAPIHIIRPTYMLFVLFDPIVMGTSPQNDAVEIARLVLESGSGNAPELQRRLGWSKRRLNPALALIVPLISQGRVRQAIQPDYVTLGFAVSPDERFRLRRLVESTAGRKLPPNADHSGP